MITAIIVIVSMTCGAVLWTEFTNARRIRRDRIFSEKLRAEHKERCSKWPSAAPHAVAWESLLDAILKGTNDEIFDALMVYVKREGHEVARKLWPGLLCLAIRQSRVKDKRKAKT